MSLRKILDISELGPEKRAVLSTLHMFMLFCYLCFKDREAEADRTDKAEAGPASGTSPAGKEAGVCFVTFPTCTLPLPLLALSQRFLLWVPLRIWWGPARAASATPELITVLTTCPPHRHQGASQQL